MDRGSKLPGVQMTKQTTDTKGQAQNARSLPAYLRQQTDHVLLSLKVQPRASRSEIGEVVGSELKVKVTAPPVDAAANEAVLRLLSERLGCPRGRLQLVRGNTSRHKTIAIFGLSIEAIQQRLS